MLLNRPPLHEVSDRAAEHYDSFRDAVSGVREDADYPAYTLEAIADQAFANRDWRFAWRAYADALRTGSILIDQRKCVLNTGRCALYLSEASAAVALLTDFVETFPTDPEGLFYLGRAFQRVHRYFDALNCLSAALQIDPDNPNLHAASGQIAHALAFQGFGHTEGARSGTYLSVAETGFSRALQIDAANFEALSGRMLFRLDCGMPDAALADFEALAVLEDAVEPERIERAAINLALSLARGGHLETLDRIDYLARFPAGERILARANALRGETAAAASPPASETPTAIYFDPVAEAWMVGPCGDGRWRRARAELAGDPRSAVSIAADWIVSLRATHWAGIRQLIARLAALPVDFVAIATFDGTPSDGTARPPIANFVVRKSAWDELVTVCGPSLDWESVTRQAVERLRIYAQATEPSATGQPASPQLPAFGPARHRVLVLSRHGPRRLGGGEQFLSDAAQTYARHENSEVLFAGLTADPGEALDTWPMTTARPAEAFLLEDTGALRDFCLANRVTAIHTLSGLGETVIEAVSGLNIRLIYGVHFWREFAAAGVPSRPWYPSVGRDSLPPPDPAFEAILARADFAYVNSDYCEEIAAELYNWRPPVLHSVPALAPSGEAPASTDASWLDDYVLLVNSRADKGWYVFLAIAEALPERPFVAIAGQSDIEAARADIHHRRLFNVTVIDRADRMNDIYRRARVVLVPSFTFVETFSRVAIEAGRHGRPVLMADAGNLSRLGADTSLLLPENPPAWIDAVDRLFTDDGFNRRLTDQSVEMSERFDHDALIADLARLPIGSDTPRILVCVGSGIGNVCHTTPMIARLADYFDTRVDVLVAGDFPGTGALLAGASQVGSVFETYAHVRHRAYDRVFVTHSFGSVVPAFNAPRVHVSRDADRFDPAGETHETEFNLRFIEDSAGVPRCPSDATAYFMGGWTWSPLSSGERPLRVALHAGSKGGVWVSKRWPHFAQLTRELARLGVEVVSLGVADEYVPGTIDRTGGSIARMTDELSVCNALITNDSGVMNIANALGMPVLALFAPTNPATRAPLNSPSVVLTPDTECAPCEARLGFAERFSQGTCRCIGLIAPSRVRKALVELGLPIAGNAD